MYTAPTAMSTIDVDKNKLFRFFADNHNLILLDSELDDIVYVVYEAKQLTVKVKPEQIIAAACKAFNVPEEELLSNSRKAVLVRVRNICFKVLRMKTDLSLVEIAKVFGKDHTTVIHGLRCIENELSVPAYRQQMNIDLRSVMELI